MLRSIYFLFEIYNRNEFNNITEIDIYILLVRYYIPAKQLLVETF